MHLNLTEELQDSCHSLLLPFFDIFLKLFNSNVRFGRCVLTNTEFQIPGAKIYLLRKGVEEFFSINHKKMNSVGVTFHEITEF